MEMAKLVTMRFDKNVGSADRAFRLLGGSAMACTGWLLGLAIWQSFALTLLGVMTLASGLLSRCTIYYILGYSTCPVSGKPFAARQV